MNIVDVGLLLLLFFAALRGYSRGFFHELLSLVSIVAGCAVAFRFCPAVAEGIAVRATMPYFLTISLAFLALFFPVVIGVRIANTLVERFWVSMAVSPQNRLAGMGFGVLKGALVLGSAVILLRSSVPVSETRDAFAGRFLGVAEELQVRVQESQVGDALARVSLGIFAVAMDKGQDWFVSTGHDGHP
jgi:membrane protein required for colicin V production